MNDGSVPADSECQVQAAKPLVMLEVFMARVDTSPDQFLSAELARCLTEAGFIAIFRNVESDAEQIFLALAKLRPERGYPLIGLGLLALMAKRPAKAVQLLQQAVQCPDDAPEAEVFLRLAQEVGGGRLLCG